MNLKNQYALQKGSRSDNLDAKNGDKNFERADNRSAPNMPDRFELFTLGDGEKKIEEVTDTREYPDTHLTIPDHALTPVRCPVLLNVHL